jgi:hypothetical protein
MSANAVWIRWLIELGWDEAPVERVMDALVQASFEEAREMWRYRVAA